MVFDQANITIFSLDPAVITYHSNLTVKANENDQITLMCNVSGVPTPSVNWTINGKQIKNAHGENYVFNAVDSLSGNYSCIVSNGIGAIQRKTFDVKITGYSSIIRLDRETFGQVIFPYN